MKRYKVYEITHMGYIDVPDDADPFTFMEENDAWPEENIVVDHEITEVVFDEEYNMWVNKE